MLPHSRGSLLRDCFLRESIVCSLHLLHGERDVSCAFLNKTKTNSCLQEGCWGHISSPRRASKVLKLGRQTWRHFSFSLCTKVPLLGSLPEPKRLPVLRTSFLCRRTGLLTEGPGSQAERALVRSEGTGVCVLSGSIPSSQPPRAASWLSCLVSSAPNSVEANLSL